MRTPSTDDIRDLIERLGRISTADEWADGLNPTQRAALSYLSRANRFSRAPSHVADFLTATRGTVSQTLKALARKGLIEETRSQTDRRSISYTPTRQGQNLLKRTTDFDHALEQLPASVRKAISDSLKELVRATLQARGNKQFGQCKACRHHQRRGANGYCSLLNEDLSDNEVSQICHEFEQAA